MPLQCLRSLCNQQCCDQATKGLTAVLLEAAAESDKLRQRARRNLEAHLKICDHAVRVLGAAKLASLVLTAFRHFSRRRA